MYINATKSGAYRFTTEATMENPRPCPALDTAWAGVNPIRPRPDHSGPQRSGLEPHSASVYFRDRF